MIYHLYQAQSDFAEPGRIFARFAAEHLAPLQSEADTDGMLRRLLATYEVVGHLRLTHQRLSYIIPSVMRRPRGQSNEEAADKYNRSARSCISARIPIAAQPRVLLVAPLSGHFATLLRDTIRTMLPDHDGRRPIGTMSATSRSATAASGSTIIPSI